MMHLEQYEGLLKSQERGNALLADIRNALVPAEPMNSETPPAQIEEPAKFYNLRAPGPDGESSPRLYTYDETDGWASIDNTDWIKWNESEQRFYFADAPDHELGALGHFIIYDERSDRNLLIFKDLNLDVLSPDAEGILNLIERLRRDRDDATARAAEARTATAFTPGFVLLVFVLGAAFGAVTTHLFMTH